MTKLKNTAATIGIAILLAVGLQPRPAHGYSGVLASPANAMLDFTAFMIVGLSVVGTIILLALLAGTRGK